MYLPRHLFTLFCCIAGKTTHKSTKIPMPASHFHRSIAVNRHIHMPAFFGKRPNPYAYSALKQQMPLRSYHSSSEGLFEAIKNNNVDGVKELLKTYEDVLSAKNEYEMTPFLWAAFTYKGHFEILELLKEKGADIDDEDGEGNNALHLACFKGMYEMVRWLVEECELSLEAKNEHEMTPFLCAALSGYLEIVKLLKEKGADINAKGEEGNNALHYACRFSASFETVAWLLDECDLSLEDKEELYGMPPFLWAALSGYLEIVKLFQERGADVNTTDEEGHNALHLACKDGRSVTVKWFLDNCDMNLEAKGGWSQKTPFLFAAEHGYLEIVKLLQERGANINATDKYGWTSLHLACYYGRREMVKWLIDNCDINLEAKERWTNKTPFLRAAEHGYLEIVKLLQERGANIYAADKWGCTALEHAQQTKNQEVISYLQSVDVKAN